MKTSLLITTHNRTHLLAKSLWGALRDGMTSPDQIVVVDDGGDDGCERYCLAMAAAGYPIEYHRLDNPGDTNCCRARNIALRAARNDHVVVSEPELLFLTDVIGEFERQRSGTADDHTGVLHEPFCWHAPHAGAELADCVKVPGFYVHSFMKPWLEKVGGWDEALPGPWGWDDIDLYGRLAYNGHPRVALEGVEVMHQWHPSRIEPAIENEAHARAKVFPRDLVANR